MFTIRTNIIISSVLTVFTVTGCASGTMDTAALPANDVSSSPAVSSIPATQNVSYEGTLEALGPSVYQQGTHKLTMSDGRFIILVSGDSSLDLNTYIGTHVEAKGSVQPVIEGNGNVSMMSVEQIAVLGESSSSTVSSISSFQSSKTVCGGEAWLECPAGKECVDDPSDSCDPVSGGADCRGICVPGSSSSVAASTIPESSIKSSTALTVSSTAVSPSTSSDSSDFSADIEHQIVTMAKQDYATASLWTQKYCTTYIGFCIPTHKQWYFKSFGAGAGTLWHVEFAMKDISSVGQGPIVLNLVSGLSASKSKMDGAVETSASEVIGYKDWTNNRHFEITADARLKAAVSYMLSHIETYEFSQ